MRIGPVLVQGACIREVDGTGSGSIRLFDKYPCPRDRGLGAERLVFHEEHLGFRVLRSPRLLDHSKNHELVLIQRPSPRSHRMSPNGSLYDAGNSWLTPRSGDLDLGAGGGGDAVVR